MILTENGSILQVINAQNDAEVRQQCNFRTGSGWKKKNAGQVCDSLFPFHLS